MPLITQTRLDRFLSRHQRDNQKYALLIEIHTLRGEGWPWGRITLALADAIDGIRSEPIHHAFASYAGPFKLWEAVMQVIAEAWGQERERHAEVTAEREDEQASADGLRRLAKVAIYNYRRAQ